MSIGFTPGLTQKRVEANETLAFERAVVTVLPQLYESGMSSAQIHQVFTEKISPPDGTSGDAYTYKQNGQVVGYALPFAGQGFWAPLRASLASRPTGRR